MSNKIKCSHELVVRKYSEVLKFLKKFKNGGNFKFGKTVFFRPWW